VEDDGVSDKKLLVAIGKYMERCNICQRMKNRMEVPAGKLKLSKMPEKLWTYLMVDFITKLLVVAGKDVILVVCNRLSKMTHFVATTEETSVEGLAKLFRDNVCYESCMGCQRV